MNSYQKNAFSFATIVAMGGFVFGLDAALISGTINFIVQEFSLSDLQLGTVVSAPGLGVLIALPFAGYICDRFGRKKALQIVAALYLISALASTFAPSYATLVFARFLGGLAFSSISLASMYIGEIAPAKLRGRLVSMTQINIVVGLLAAYLLNYFILNLSNSEGSLATTLGVDVYTWRWMLGSEILFALFWYALLFVIPESPAWLCANGKSEEAERTLGKIYPQDLIPAHIQEIHRDLESTQGGSSLKDQLSQLLSPRMRLIAVIALTIAVAQQATGINAILFYAPTVFEQIGLGTDAAFVQAIGIGIVSVLFTVLSILLIDKIGRRPMIIWGMLWIVLSLGLGSFGFFTARYQLGEEVLTELSEIRQVERLAPLAGVEFTSDTDFKEAIKELIGEEDFHTHSGLLMQKATLMNSGLVLLAILSFIAAFHFSVGPIMWVLFSELFPNSLRGIAIPLFALISSLVNYFVQQFFPWQLTHMGGGAIFLSYAMVVALGLVILYRYLPETKNLSIEEVQMKLGAISAPTTEMLKE